jgi:hypothetical protein
MNNMAVIAWMDDWQMSARLAKLSTTYSYQLIFCENWQELPDSNTNMVIIIELGKLKDDELKQLQELKNNNAIFIIGYKKNIDGGQAKYYKEQGCDMVLRRNKLLKNLDPILNKINNAC